MKRSEITVKSAAGGPEAKRNPEIPEAEVRRELESITASPAFQNSARMVRFLRFVVERTLEKDPGAIKEYTIGVEVFDRTVDFDPKTDTIVRVEARRLRRKLNEYYDAEGSENAFRIDVPAPGYVPVFTVRATKAEAPPKSSSRRFALFGDLAALEIALVVIGYWATHRGHSGDIASIAVLPFTNLSGDPKQQYFCDGFTEELIDRLSAAGNLKVVARTSAFEYKDKARDVRDIGRNLGVDSIVEGSVRRQGDVVRITAQLIRTRDGYHVWSRSWDRRVSDVLAVQGDVAQLIADTVRRPVPVRRQPALNLEAYDLYLVGRSHWYKQQPDELFKAIDYFEQAISVDPKFALAYSGLSEAYSYLIDLDLAPTRELGEKAKAAAEKALALDETLAEAHTSRGLVAYDVEWNPQLAEKEFRRALELKPNFAYGIHWYAHFLESRGAYEEAEREMKRAQQLDPLSRMLAVDVGGIAMKRRRFDEAAAAFQRTRELDPGYFVTDIAESWLALAQGNAPKAVQLLEGVRHRVGDAPLVMATLANAKIAAGDSKFAYDEVASLKRRSGAEYVPAYTIALVYYALGDRAEGLRWLQKAFDDRSGMLLYLRDLPALDNVRADPAAGALLKRMGERAG